MILILILKLDCRIPSNKVTSMLSSVFGVKISDGEIYNILNQFALYVVRKISNGSRSEDGAETTARLLSVLQTVKLQTIAKDISFLPVCLLLYSRNLKAMVENLSFSL